jgi:cbb3-type cytochrome oxidase maturation protein
MSSLFYLIPLSLLLLGGAVVLFVWALRRGQFDDLESAANRIIIDDREERASVERRQDD